MKAIAKPKWSAVLKHPFFVVIPLIAAFMFGWHQYLQAARGLNEPSHNILAGGNFDHFDARGVPEKWTLAKDGDLDYKLGSMPGYVNGQAFTLQTSNYHKGDLLLASAQTPVESG